MPIAIEWLRDIAKDLKAKNNFNNSLAISPAIKHEGIMSDLTKPYEPALIYYEDADAAEYLTRDAAAIYEEVGPGTAIVRDMESREIIGFRITDPKAWARFITAQ